MTIQASFDDIPLLSGYLHDATFTPSDINMDEERNIFILEMERIFYEGGRKGKFLFFIPVKRYPFVKTRLSITNVENISEEWLDSAFNEPKDKHCLLYIEKIEDDVIKISSDYLILKIKALKETVLFVEDIGGPSKKLNNIDFSGSIFRGLDLIEELKEKSLK